MFSKLKCFCLFLSVFLISALILFSETPVNPFPDFPDCSMVSEPGEYVLTPGYGVQERATNDGPERVTFIYYHAQMEEPGDTHSKIKYTFDGVKEIPNYMIIPLAKGQTAKKGDILLSWWQSGSGLMRAFVVDDSDPKQPIVRYLDIAYDNPAERDGVSIGQMEEQLRPDSFIKITQKGDPGTSVAIPDEQWGGYSLGTVMKVEGDKVLVLGHAGRASIVDKDKCIFVPVIPEVSEGDTVQVPRAGRFLEGTVTKVDAEIGRVFVETRRGDSVIAFGDIMTGLEL